MRYDFVQVLLHVKFTHTSITSEMNSYDSRLSYDCYTISTKSFEALYRKEMMHLSGHVLGDVHLELLQMKLSVHLTLRKNS